MGVDLSVWADVVRRHPLKFKFAGLNRPATAVQTAVLEDRYACERLWDHYCSEQYSYYTSEDCDSYKDYVAEAVKDGEEPMSQEEWAQDQLRCEGEFGVEPEFWLPDDDVLLKDYPIEGIWEHAGESSVDLDKVLMICPGCGHNPIDVEWGAGGGGPTTHGFYCGLCGCESSWEDEADMYEVMLDIGRVPWPFAPEKREAFYQHCRETERPPHYPDDRAEYEAWLAGQSSAS